MKTWDEYVALMDAISEYAQTCGGDTGERTVSDKRMAAVVKVNNALAQYAGFDQPNYPGSDVHEAGHDHRVDGDAEHHELLHDATLAPGKP